MESLNVVTFAKYHGCGNSFIILSNLNGEYDYILKDKESVKKICDPDFGIGSDGIMCIKAHDEHDFVTEYYNGKFGKLSGFCGNGTRCSVLFARDTGIIEKNTGTLFSAGRPRNFIIENNHITVKINDIDASSVLKLSDGDFFITSDVVHHVKFTTNVKNVDVATESQAIGRECRGVYNKFHPKGPNFRVNVSYVEDHQDSKFRIRTYETAIETETQACGSGCVASAIAAAVTSTTEANTHFKHTMVTNGGNVVVEFRFDGLMFSDIMFTGPATKVCSGKYYL